VIEELSKATHSLDVVIEDIRHYILNLKVATYEQQTLRRALLDVVARLHIPATLHVEVNAPDRQPPFAPPVVEAVCQIAYEALSNIVRHAGATQATITVSESAEQFQMVITDDGGGLPSSQPTEQGGLGLPNMMQRARIHGGEVVIENASGGGTRVTLRLPL
jgi:signal transduction histidine kinase